MVKGSLKPLLLVGNFSVTSKTGVVHLMNASDTAKDPSSLLSSFNCRKSIRTVTSCTQEINPCQKEGMIERKICNHAKRLYDYCIIIEKETQRQNIGP